MQQIFDLRSQIEILERSKVDLLHIDVMDGNFVSRMAFGAEHIQMIKRHTKIPLDVHLMVKYPERHISDILEAGADIIMLPMWKSLDDVKNFLTIVDKRVKTTLLL